MDPAGSVIKWPPGYVFQTYGSKTLSISVADPDPGSGAFLTPGSVMGKKSGSGIDNPELLNKFWVKKILKFFGADPERKKFRILDGKN